MGELLEGRWCLIIPWRRERLVWENIAGRLGTCIKTLESYLLFSENNCWIEYLPLY